MTDIHHLENRQIAILSKNHPILMKFGFWTRWQSRDQIWKFLKFKTADGRYIENRSFGHNSAAYCQISVKFCAGKQFFTEFRQ